MELEKELSILRRQRSQYGVVHAEVSRLVTEREELDSQVRHQKLQLRSCKAEVAAMQETAGARTEQLQEVVQAASELDRRTRELEQRVLALQKILSEKELELLRLHKTIFALEAEKERWDSAVESLKQEHKRQVEKLQVEAVQEKERDFAQLQKEKQQLVQELTEKTEQTKTKALQEQASTFQKEVEDLRKIIEDRDAELARQQEATHQQARKLKQDAEEKVQSSLLQEQQKWEADAKVALHMQKETLEEQCRNTQTELQEALEEERRSRYALQAETDGLHKRIQELETQAQLLQGEKRTALEELRVRLQEEKAQALSQLREELEQERNQMRARLQQIELDRRLLQAEQQGAFPWEQGDHTHAEWTDRSLAREVTLACQRLQHLLPKQAGTPSLSWMFRGSLAFLSTSHALQALQEVSEETQCYLQDLKHEIETQKHNIRQLQREKEEELRQQQERLRQESQANLEALKDHLVQEHMKDIATLQRSWVKEKRMGEKHVLLKQLQEKDEELRAVQRSMACWKDETARKLAHKFQKQLDAELEQCHSKDESMDIHRQLETTESEIRVSCMNLGEDLRPHSVGSLSLKSAPLPRQHNFGTPKLLHHLQSQIQALRSENTLCLEDVSRLREGLDTTYRSKRHLASDLSSTQLHGKSIRN
ncbi:trichohyalin-like [Eublepharis macularius]|uniref:Trichohyalin-like n=1 Tax=Eublepharis macularius TaxID=481883 RepID=A0AA97KAH3_EUBMA|nr:trichohyalin-like [Eublepharis macularius]